MRLPSATLGMCRRDPPQRFCHLFKQDFKSRMRQFNHGANKSCNGERGFEIRTLCMKHEAPRTKMSTSRESCNDEVGRHSRSPRKAAPNRPEAVACYFSASEIESQIRQYQHFGMEVFIGVCRARQVQEMAVV